MARRVFDAHLFLSAIAGNIKVINLWMSPFLLSSLLLLVCAMLHALRALQVGGLFLGVRENEILCSFQG